MTSWTKLHFHFFFCFFLNNVFKPVKGSISASERVHLQQMKVVGNSEGFELFDLFSS